MTRLWATALVLGWAARAHAQDGGVSAALWDGNYAGAVHRARGAVEHADSPLTRAHALGDLARALAADGRMADGEAGHAAEAALAAISADDTPTETAGALLAAADVAARMGRTEDTVTHAQHALTLLRGVGPETAARCAELQALLAEARLASQRFDDALAAVEAGLVDAATVGPPADTLLTARLLTQRAWTRQYLGQIDDSHAAAEAAIAALSSAQAVHPEAVQSWLALGNADAMAGRMDEATEHIRHAADIAATSLRPGHPLAAFAESRLAIQEAEAGLYHDAYARHARAVEAARTSLGELHPQSIDLAVDEASAYFMAGDYAVAGARYANALALSERLRGPASLAVATLAFNRGLALAEAGDWTQAQASLERALGIWSSVHGERHIHVALAQHELGRLMARQERHTEAVVHFRNALALRVALLGAGNPSVAVTRALLAASLARLGNMREAEAQADMAESLLATEGGWRDLERVRLQALLGRLRAARGDDTGAARYAEQSSRLLAAHVVRHVRFLSEPAALSFVDQAFEGRDLLLQMAARRGAPGPLRRAALEAAVRSRHLVLDEIAARAADARTAQEPRLAGAWARFATARQRLATLVHRGAGAGGEAGQQQLRALDEEADAAERQLALAGSTRARPPDAADIGSLQRALPPGSALVSFVRHASPGAAAQRSADAGADARYTAFVLRPADAAPAAIALGAAPQIDALVEAWRRALLAGLERPDDSDAGRAQRDAGRALAQRVWDPLRPLLAGASRVLVVPDGELLFVSFAALPSGPRRFVLEDGPTVHLLGAERDLLALPAAAPAPRGILIVANPAFDNGTALQRQAGDEPAATPAGRPHHTARGGDTCAEDSSFAPLPASGDEARDLAGLWSRSGRVARAVTGIAASESAVKLLAPQFDVVHMATHGFYHERDCGAAAALRTPLSWRAGLPLAGANQRARAEQDADDGILTPPEIAALDLSRVGWVVLSACETGRGGLQDREGVQGLRRAFAIAGAHTLVLSLWPVDDVEAQRFMRALYEARVVRGLDTAEAMRAAGLAALHTLHAGVATRAQPALWGAFVAIGDWR